MQPRMLHRGRTRSESQRLAATFGSHRHVPRSGLRDCGRSRISPTLSAKRVTFVVITAVGGVPFSEICTSAFCTAMAATPSMPATIAMPAFGSGWGPAATRNARKPVSSSHCRTRRGCNEGRSKAFKPATRNRARTSTVMKIGTDRITATGASPWLTTCAARMTRLPVICAVNRPPSPRKPMASVLPAMTASTEGSSFVTSESSIDRSKTRCAGQAACLFKQGIARVCENQETGAPTIDSSSR